MRRSWQGEVSQGSWESQIKGSPHRTQIFYSGPSKGPELSHLEDSRYEKKKCQNGRTNLVAYFKCYTEHMQYTYNVLE